MKKKVFIMINSLGIGGAEKSLVSFLNLVDYDRFDIDLQMMNFGGAFETFVPNQVNILPDLNYLSFCRQSSKQQLFSCNIRYILARLKTWKSLRTNCKNNQLLHDTQAYWRGSADAFEQLKKEYDVAIAWGQGTPTHYVASKVKASKKIAWINADYEAVGHNADFDRPIYARYDLIVGVSDKLSNTLRHVFPEYAERIVTVYDINSAALITKMAQEEKDCPKLHGLILSTTGRLVPPKGYDLSIETARILKERGVDFTWLICGDGPERALLERKINEYKLSDSYILLGSQANPYPYMNKADVYVQTSRSEGYCITLTEARILNKPCVATCFDVVYDQIVPGENGLVVKMNPEAIAEGIIKLSKDRELYDHIFENLKNEKKGNEEEIDKIHKLISECENELC